MRLSNFKLTGQSESGCVMFAEVDVTVGALWWKKTVRRQLFREGGLGDWYWLDTGSPASVEVTFLARAAAAQRARV